MSTATRRPLFRAAPLDPNDPGDLVKLEAALALSMSGKATPAQARALARIRALMEIPPGDTAAISAFEAALREEILGMAAPTAEALEGVVGTSAEGIYARTRAALRGRVGFGALRTGFQAVDHAAVRALETNHTFFVRNGFGHLSSSLSERARRIVGNGLKDGLGREEIAAILQNKITGTLQRKGYLETLASLFVNRTRTTAQLNAYQQVGIERFVFLAILDRVTTEICRFLHLKTFSTAKAQARMNTALHLPEPADVENVLPFLREGKNSDGEPVISVLTPSGRQRIVAQVQEAAFGKVNQVGKYDQKVTDRTLEDLGVGPPPSHFRCRSTTAPV